jgi:hypothetical protein
MAHGGRIRIAWYRRSAGVVLVALLSACGGDNPQKIAQQFYEAFERHQFSTAREYVCPALNDELDVWEQTPGIGPVEVAFDVRYEEIQRTDQHILLWLTGTRQAGGETFAVHEQIRLDKQGGWKVCDMRDAP